MFSHPKSEGILQKARDVISNSREWAKTGQEMAQTGSHRARRFIHQKPMTATLIGLGVGYLLGKLFSKTKPAVMLPALAKRRR